MMIVAVLLVACPPVTPPVDCKTNPDLDQCYRPPCLDTPEGCQEPKIILETTLKSPPRGEDFARYVRGEEFDGTMTLTLDDPDKVIRQAVVFLNVVACISETAPFCKQVNQVDIRTVFDENASTFRPDINKKLYQGAEVNALRSGISTTLDAKLIPSVNAGRYALAVQVFNCTQTDPMKVGIECEDKKIDKTKAYRFQVTQ